jgi:hypothetical protein
MIMKKITKPFISMPKHPLSSATGLPPPPPPPPPLKFDIIIAQVYGPTADIYKDIFAISPTASENELTEAYLRIRNQTQAKLDMLSNSGSSKSILNKKERDKAKQKKLLVKQISAIYGAYHLLIDVEKRKEYDKSIGLKEQSSEDTSVHRVDLNIRMKQYLKGKQNGAKGRICFEDYDIISTKETQIKKVQFSLQPLGSSSPEEYKKVPIVSPAGVAEFDYSLFDPPDLTRKNSPGDAISPIARLRLNKEQKDDQDDSLADVFASYLKLNNFIPIHQIEQDERTDVSDSCTIGEDEWSSEGLEFSCFTEEVIATAAYLVDGLCQQSKSLAR